MKGRSKGDLFEKGLVYLGLIILFSSMVYATADVAYITNIKTNVQQNVTSVFSEMNLSYDVITDASIKNVNLSKYKFLFLDDSRLQNTAKLPIYNYPSVIMNYYYGEQWGLADDHGVSQMVSNQPLNVNVVGNGIEQVYTTAGIDGTDLPYYFLDDKYKANFTSVAKTYRTYNFQLGDVIAFAPKGTLLKNNKISQGSICFYGIAKSGFWTDAARNMFKSCVGSVLSNCKQNSDCGSTILINNYCNGSGVVSNYSLPACNSGRCSVNYQQVLNQTCSYGCNNGVCNPKPICINNTDCGIDGFIGNQFCSGNNVSQNFITFTCNNPGQQNSFCSNSTSALLNQTCSDICDSGKCKTIVCRNDSDCNDNNVSTKDTCLNPGTYNSSCIHTPIACFSNNDCGTNTLSGNLCSGSNVVQNFMNFTCNNPGQVNSFCSNQSGSYNIQQCSQKCLSGSCITINCTQNSDCIDLNDRTFDECINPNTTASFCRNTEVNCLNDNDCGIMGFLGDNFCSGNNVFKYFQNSTCVNPGTLNSNCNIVISPKLINNCDDNNTKTVDSCVADDKARCENRLVTCNNDSECSGGGFINNFCSGSSLMNNISQPVCLNAGSVSSSCSFIFASQLNQTCDFGCNNGNCLSGMHDVALVDFSGSQNGIKITNSSGDVVPNNSLLCNQKYIFFIEPKNMGNFTENISFLGSVDGLPLSYSNTMLLAGQTGSPKQNTVNITLASGFYNVSVQAMIPIDNNPSNNFALRQIQVVCPSPNCSQNSDCGSTILINNYCNGSGVVSNYSIPSCNSGNCNVNYQQVLNQTCSYGCNNGNCNPQPNCNSNGECGQDGFIGNQFCSGNNVSRNFITFTCNNPGQQNSFCSNSTALKNLQTCSDTCQDGVCNPPAICNQDSDCGTNTLSGNLCSGSNVINNYLNFTCNNPGEQNSFCSSASGSLIVQTCSLGCINGTCNNPPITCRNDSDCDDSDPRTIDQCVFPGSQSSFCRNTEVNCISNTDCGITGFTGDEFCLGNSVFKNFQASLCQNPGTLDSNCLVNITALKIQSCGDGICQDGACFFPPVICSNNSDCGNSIINAPVCSGNNSVTTRTDFTCNNPGLQNSFCSNQTINKTVQECSGICSNGTCNNITCSQNSDCGVDGFIGDPFCMDNALFSDFMAFTCNNPGQVNSFCSNSTTEQKVEDCESKCMDDNCVSISNCMKAKSKGLLKGKLTGDGSALIIDKTNQSFRVGLAVYQKFGDSLKQQRLFDYSQEVVGWGNTSLSVNLPDCKYQIDLFCGSVINSFDGTRYDNRLFDSGSHGTGKCVMPD